MATTRSGSKQTLTVDGVAMHGVRSGFTGLNLGQESGSFETSSGGLTVMEDSGYRVNSAEFAVNETEVTAPALLCQSGTRKPCVWDDGTGTAKNFTGILAVTRAFTPRAQTVFNVSLAIDGALT